MEMMQWKHAPLVDPVLKTSPIWTPTEIIKPPRPPPKKKKPHKNIWMSDFMVWILFPKLN